MIDIIREASLAQFLLGYIALFTLFMIVLQVGTRHEVWAGYVVLLFASLFGLGVTIR